MTATDPIKTGRPDKLRHWLDSLSAPVDAASLAVFRILFGSIMGLAMIRFLAKGWVKTQYLDPAFHFPWVSWIAPWPGHGMYVHVVVLALLAFGIAAGFCYRLCAVLFWAGFTYLEFIDRTTYLNHYYLVSLLSGLLMFLPAHAQWSIDARLHPRLRRETVPRWCVLLLQFQIGVVYLFSGLAKLNADWLFEAQPLRIWLMAKSDLPLLGTWLAEPWVAYAASWFGAAYDLSIPFLLLWSRTRPVAFGAVIFFHLMTAMLFPIGIFPWIMIAASLIFFSASWPRRLLQARENRKETMTPVQPRLSYATGFLLAMYVAAQLLVPLRSWLYPQQGAWDGRGFNFAWRVMLVEKTGYVEFYEFDPADGSRTRIATQQFITPRQRMMMAQDPYLIRQFARFLGHKLDATNRGREIRVDAVAKLNGHPSQHLVRPGINLAGECPPDWLVPHRQPAVTDVSANTAQSDSPSVILRLAEKNSESASWPRVE